MYNVIIAIFLGAIAALVVGLIFESPKLMIGSLLAMFGAVILAVLVG